MSILKRAGIIFLALVLILSILAFVVLPKTLLEGSRTYEKVTIPAKGYEIAGYLSLGRNTDGNWVIFAHGNRSCGQNHPLYHEILENLDGDISVLAIDFSGYGDSDDEGMLLSDDILDRSADIHAAASFLRAEFGVQEERIVLVGHSLGAAQIMLAAKGHAYRALIPIGLGDYRRVMNESGEQKDYIEKFEENTGVTLTDEDLLENVVEFTPEALFSPCPKMPVYLVFGAHDYDLQTLSEYYWSLPASCQEMITLKVIPLADHMYGTESSGLPGLVRPAYSKLLLNLLLGELNKMITS
jgi:pimeloyl-ACP methyl ester carboxylesterase